MIRGCVFCCSAVFFFFKQKTAYEMRISDWSSDVCSSDLREIEGLDGTAHEITSGSDDLSGRAESQAASLEETAASMHELNATVQQTTDIARSANEQIGRESCRERVCQYV